METWLIYAIISIFAAGIHNFLLKVSTEKNYNGSLTSLLWYSVWAVVACIYFLYTWGKIDGWEWMIYFAFGNVLFYFLSMLTRMEGMRNIDTVIFYPLYKTISPVLVTLVSFFFFQEVLSLKEGIWIIIGIMIPLMLITSHENKIQRNLKKWVIFVIFTSLFIGVSAAFSKGVMIEWANVELFIFLSMWLGSIISAISYKFFHKNSKGNYNKEWMLKFGFIIWIFHFLAFMTFQKALTWNLAVVFTINSFSILVPIILSVIYYKDHFNKKKAFVIALSIVSILLFI
jgi:multidrug transporter EmrE-like cation transporter